LLVEEVENTKNGYEAWQALAMMRSGPRSPDCTLTLVVPQAITSAVSSNRFQTYYNRHLDGEEKFSEQTKVQMFLKHVRDPHYKTVIEVIKNQTGQGNLKLIQVIARI
jgi:hypothetical protein